MNKFGFSTAIFLFVILFNQSLFGQAKIEVIPQNDTTVTLSASGFDILQPLVGGRAEAPYYTYLWIFGDGTFIMNTRDSVVDHTFEKVPGTTFTLRNTLETRVYPTNNYGGGTRPPTGEESLAPDPTIFLFRSPSYLKQFMGGDSLRTDGTPAIRDTSVIDTTESSYLRLQLNHDVKPEDTLVNILSFRNLHSSDIRGQLYLFYNSKITEKNRVPRQVAGEFENGESIPEEPATPTYSKFDNTGQLIHFDKINEVGIGNTSAMGIDEFQNFLVFNYDRLAPNGSDERHLFLEFENDTSLWNMINEEVENSGDSVKFLAVMTALDFNKALIDSLPSANNAYLNDIGISGLLGKQYFDFGQGDTLEFLDVGNSDLNVKIIGASEVPSAIKKSHDPNKLEIYACECPEEGREKLVCRISCTNDGSIPTSGVKFLMNIPDALDINTIENISHHPTHTPSGNFPLIDETTREVSWNWFAFLQSAQSFGADHPDVRGEVVFSILLKEGASIDDIDPMNACIQFDINAPECTSFVSPDSYTTTIKNKEVVENLKCKSCELEPTACCFGMPYWLCCLICFLLLLLALYILNLLYAYFKA